MVTKKKMKKQSGTNGNRRPQPAERVGVGRKVGPAAGAQRPSGDGARAVLPARRRKVVARRPSPVRSKGIASRPATPTSREGPTVVVGVGASAGGFEAFRQFIGSIPPDSGIAFVLIQHLDPTHPSLTAELMRRHTTMPVVEAEEEMRIEPSHVYVIPPNRYLTIRGQRLHLAEPIERRGLRVPIDYFFRSLAQQQQERAIGIILSGTGTDGTLGVREIKAAGGMAMVQAPETATHEGMSRSAIATGLVDYILPVERMAEALLGYVRHGYVNGGGAAAERQPAPDHVHSIIGLLQARSRFDFSGYKKGTLSRRILRRMGLRQIERPAAYVDYLRGNDAELKALHKDLLITVTSFFREPETWQDLEKLVIEPMVREHADGSPIRAWVPGCATGEEPYTLAMLLIEQIEAAGLACELQVFASDVDAEAVAIARAGIYPESIAADVSAERIRRFFIRSGHTCRVNKQLRESVVFAEQNVIDDPPFSKLDLISCRNLLIYLEPEVQKRVLSLFHFALIEGGRLLLGVSETIGHRQDLFKPVSRKHRIYRRVGPGRPKGAGGALPPMIGEDIEPRPAPSLAEPHGRHGATMAQRLMLKHFAPACAVIDRDGEVIYLHGPLDRFLHVPTGEPTRDLISMARDELRSVLRAAVSRAITGSQKVSVPAVRPWSGEKAKPIRIVVEPLPGFRPSDGVLLVSFEDATLVSRAPRPRPAKGRGREGDAEATIRRLEEDVRITREDLRSSIDELETSNEEFRAANEEVTSINEELQSTNEELETSKEELQSLNEELQTVNSQLELKVQELEAANNDLANLFTSAEIATVFLDRDLRIRRFTPDAQKLMPMIQGDLGRPLGDLVHGFTDDELLADAKRVLDRMAPIEREATDREGRSYLRRTMPYRTEDGRIEGVIITFADVTTLKAQADELRTLNEDLHGRVARRTAEVRRLMEAVADATVVVNERGEIVELNQGTERLFGWSRDELVGQPVEVLVPDRHREDHRADRVAYFRQAYARPMGAGLELYGHRKDGSEFSLDVQLTPMEMNDEPVVVAAIRDVTQLRLAEALKTRLAAVVESSTTAIILLDLDGTVRNWNRGAQKLFGYAPDEVIGRSIVGFLLPPERQDEFRTNVECLSRDEIVEDFETVRLHRDGTRIDVALTMSMVTDDTGRAPGVFAIYYDIRPRKGMDAQMADLLERERQRVGRELHDTLGQQLTAVGMLVSSLRSHGGRGEERTAALAQLERTVEESKGQLRSLIAGVFPVAVDPERLRWSLRDLAHETSRLYGLQCRLEEEGGVAEVEDGFVATQLFLVAREAVHNAVRHAQAKTIVIRLDARADETRLTVVDDGRGLPPTVDESATMGLRIMRYRSGLVGGRLAIEARPGGGTVLTLVRWTVSGGGVNARAR